SRSSAASSRRCAAAICSVRLIIRSATGCWTRRSRWSKCRWLSTSCCRRSSRMSVAELLPWQAGLWQQLAQRRQHAHAYLLHGPAGIGKRRLAERLAHWLLCQQRDNGQPCGQCKGCLLLAAGSHPDLFTLRPAEDKKTVGVDDVRELIDFIAKTAQLGGHKVVLIAEPAAEEMTLAASNALLKSLEEPSRDSVLLLISDQPSRLLPTIKSRCVQQACPSPTRAQSLAWLRQQLPA